MIRNNQMNRHSRNWQRRNHHQNHQRGAALIICLVLIVFLGALSGVVIKTVLDDRRENRTELIRQQARILQQDGLHRAEIRRQIEPDFSGETMELKAGKEGNRGLFLLKSVYNAETKAFDVEVVFQNEVNKTIFVQKQK